jgi:hypothetical protein
VGATLEVRFRSRFTLSGAFLRSRGKANAVVTTLDPFSIDATAEITRGTDAEFVAWLRATQTGLGIPDATGTLYIRRNGMELDSSPWQVAADATRGDGWMSAIIDGEDVLPRGPEIRLDRTISLNVRPMIAGMLQRQRRASEPDSTIVRRLISDDLWRCPRGDLRDRGVLLFTPAREVGDYRECRIRLTEEMYGVFNARVYALAVKREHYLTALVCRADVLLDGGIVVPDDPEDEERAAARLWVPGGR